MVAELHDALAEELHEVGLADDDAGVEAGEAEVGLHLVPDHALVFLGPALGHQGGAKRPRLVEGDQVRVHGEVGERQAHVRDVHQVLDLAAAAGPLVEDAGLHREFLEGDRPALHPHPLHVEAAVGAADRPVVSLAPLVVEHVADVLVGLAGQDLALAGLVVDARIGRQRLRRLVGVAVVGRVDPVRHGHDFAVAQEVDYVTERLVQIVRVLLRGVGDVERRQVAVPMLFERQEGDEPVVLLLDDHPALLPTVGREVDVAQPPVVVLLADARGAAPRRFVLLDPGPEGEHGIAGCLGVGDEFRVVFGELLRDLVVDARLPRSGPDRDPAEIGHRLGQVGLRLLVDLRYRLEGRPVLGELRLVERRF